VGRKIALVIGNSEYDDASLARLITPSEDVNDLASLLKSPDIGGFDEVLTLVNEAATTVRKAVARLFKEKSPDDLLLLYFSGHGVLDDQGHLYLAVKDTERDLLSGTAIPANFITGEMDRSRSKRQVLVFDCCHSGAFARGSKGVVGASVGTASVFEGTGYGRVVLTATDATQYAWEGDQIIGQADNSVFTHFMIQGLQTGEADQDHDGRITLDELYDYVYAQVVATTPKQTPGKWSYKQQGEMVIAKNPHPPVTKAVELPIELRQAIESSLAYVREGAVRELAGLLRSSNTGLVLAAQAALQHLAEDDSRRVSVAASDCLKAYEAQLQQAAQEQSARRQIEAENAAREKIRREQLAALAAVQRAAPPIEQVRPTEQQADAEIVVTAIAAQSLPLASADAETQQSASAAASMALLLLPIVIVTVGWIGGWIGDTFIYDTLYPSSGDSALLYLSLFSFWSIVGVITGLIVRRSVPSIKLNQVFTLGIGWAVIHIGFLAPSTQASTVVPSLIAVAGLTWLMNAWFVLQLPPSLMWWQALVVGAAGVVGWLIGGIVFKLAHELPVDFTLEGTSAASDLLLNIIVSGLIGGAALAIMYGLTHKEPSPAPIGYASPLEKTRPTVSATVGHQQRAALLAGAIVSIGWFAAWLAGILIGSLWTASDSGAASLMLGWLTAGVITGLVLKRVIHSAWWPAAALGVGWPLCLAVSFYLHTPGVILLAIAATWLINSLTAMLVVRNRIWLIAVLTTAAASIVWIILGNPWEVVALKFFGASYYWAWSNFFAGEPYTAIDLLLIPALTAAVAGSILTFLLYRRVEATEPV
jgi:hypothetical protein